MVFPATNYSVPAHADIMMLRLQNPVPRNLAIPAPPVTVGTRGLTKGEIRRFLRGKTYRPSGWGRGVTTRQSIGDFQFDRYPARWYDEELNRNVDLAGLARFRSSSGATIEGGDSGGPLFWVDGRTLRLVAIAQAEGRHVLTFYRGGRDRYLERPNTALWIDELMRREDCINVNSGRMTVARISGRWKVVEDNNWLYDFKGKRDEARRTLKILQYYGVNSACSVNRPYSDFPYVLVDGTIPSGAMPGEDCVSVRPIRLTFRQEGRKWLLLDDISVKFEFNAVKKSSIAAYNEAHYVRWVMRRHRVSAVCYVGRPKSSFMYFRR